MTPPKRTPVRARTLLRAAPALLALAGTPASAQFTDATKAAGAYVLGPSWGAALGDLDGDGDLDLVSGRHYFFPVILWNLGGTFDPNFRPSPFSGPTDRHGALILPIDGDAHPDLLFTHGAGGGLSSEANELYRNDGAGGLTLVAGAGGMDDPTARARCVSAADFDGDGDADLWIGNAPRVSDPAALFRNDGPLVFTDVAAAAGLDDSTGAVGGLWEDFDGDGDPDLLVGGEEFPRPTALWRNDGGTFADASSLFSPPLPVVSGADWGDYDNDGDPDLAVCDGQIGVFDTWAEGDTVTFYFNTRWMENGVDGLTVPSTADTAVARFRFGLTWDPARVFLGPAGTHPASAYSIELTDDWVGAPSFTPGVDTGIFVWRTAPGGDWEIRCSTPNTNSDTFDGFLLDGTFLTGVTATDLEDSGFRPGAPRVWRNDGGSFTEVSAALGLPAAMLNPRDVSWTDFDNDGDLDLHVVDMGTSADPNAPDALFRNDGASFPDVAAAEGVTGGTTGLGDGGVWGDVDDDGDLDLYLQEGAGPAAFSDLARNRFLRNDGARGRSIRLDLAPTATGVAALGAHATAYAGPLVVPRRVAASSWRGFQDPLRVHLGLGSATRADSLVVEWPSGGTQTFLHPFPGRYAVVEGNVPLAVDLAVACTVDDPTPAPGDTVTFTVSVTNLSGQAASGTAITNALPAGLTFAGASATAGTHDPATGVWTIGPLAAAAAETLAVAATVDAGTGGLALVDAAALSALALDRPDTMIANDADSAAVTVQASLALRSASDQMFRVGSPPTAIAPMAITDDAVTPSITAANDLRVRIPAGFPMAWDVTDVSASVTGPAAAKVATTVGYEDGGRILVLDVVADFAANDRVTVSGLSFTGFVATAPAARLELEIGNDGAISALDDRTILVFVPTDVPGEEAGPVAAGLRAAFPNPFRAVTTLRYDLPVSGPVRLRVFDVSGRLVRVLAEGERDAGPNGAVWDGRDSSGRRVAAGVYFVRLDASGVRGARTVVRLR